MTVKIKAFKVVDKDTRLGSNAAGYIAKQRLFGYKIDQIIKDVFQTINKNKLQKIFPVYSVGAIIKPAKNTDGIFCFPTFSDAINFIHEYSYLKNAIIIEVEGTPNNLKEIKFIMGGMGYLSCIKGHINSDYMLINAQVYHFLMMKEVTVLT